MAITLKNVFDITMDIIDRRLENGTLSESDVKRYRVKTMGIVNILQAELTKQGDLFDKFEVTNNPIPNILIENNGFEIVEHIGEDKIYESKGVARSYYFEVDAPCTVYIEDFDGVWNILETIVIPNNVKGFTAYKGLLTPSLNAYSIKDKVFRSILL